MNKLFAMAAVAILPFCMLGCSMPGGTSNSAGGASPAAATPAAKAEKAVDIAPLIGKTIEEMKAIIGPPTRELAGRYTWEFPQGNLAAETDYKDKKRNKVDYFGFEAKMITVGGQTAQGYPDYQRMGDLIGVDVRSKTPTSAEPGDTGMTRFEKFDIGGKTVDELSFQKISGSFRSITIRPVRGY